MTLLTLFTAPKPFSDPHIQVIQRNMLRNWRALGDEVEVVVIGDEPGIASECQALGLRHLSDVKCNDYGTPLLSSIFALARMATDSPLLAYANADILFLPDLLDAVQKLIPEPESFLGVGQRWDLDITRPLDFEGQWAAELQDLVRHVGVLHGQTGSDYFVFPRECFEEIPDFAVGRAGWDNWMIYKARREGWPVVDLSSAVTVIHQNHDYRHLPGGVAHYRQPETDVNVRLGGGRRTIFTLQDVTHTLTQQGLIRKRLDWRSFWREVEIFPLVRLRSWFFGWVFFAIFHPVKAFNELRGWLAYKLNKKAVVNE